ncbi:hypothetical protein JCM10908_006312 [Rhodotorula pacifica]|uniref:uncharacterized protein n=1 Tax=Rhodotorula pacifica TaxID=1495444 RepID=UPI00316B8AEF
MSLRLRLNVSESGRASIFSAPAPALAAPSSSPSTPSVSPTHSSLSPSLSRLLHPGTPGETPLEPTEEAAGDIEDEAKQLMREYTFASPSPKRRHVLPPGLRIDLRAEMQVDEEVIESPSERERCEAARMDKQEEPVRLEEEHGEEALESVQTPTPARPPSLPFGTTSGTIFRLPKPSHWPALPVAKNTGTARALHALLEGIDFNEFGECQGDCELACEAVPTALQAGELDEAVPPVSLDMASPPALQDPRIDSLAEDLARLLTEPDKLPEGFVELLHAAAREGQHAIADGNAGVSVLARRAGLVSAEPPSESPCRVSSLGWEDEEHDIPAALPPSLPRVRSFARLTRNRSLSASEVISRQSSRASLRSFSAVGSTAAPSPTSTPTRTTFFAAHENFERLEEAIPARPHPPYPIDWNRPLVFIHEDGVDSYEEQREQRTAAATLIGSPARSAARSRTRARGNSDTGQPLPSCLVPSLKEESGSETEAAPTRAKRARAVAKRRNQNSGDDDASKEQLANVVRADASNRPTSLIIKPTQTMPSRDDEAARQRTNLLDLPDEILLRILDLVATRHNEVDQLSGIPPVQHLTLCRHLHRLAQPMWYAWIQQSEDSPLSPSDFSQRLLDHPANVRQSVQTLVLRLADHPADDFLACAFVALLPRLSHLNLSYVCETSAEAPDAPDRPPVIPAPLLQICAHIESLASLAFEGRFSLPENAPAIPRLDGVELYGDALKPEMLDFLARSNVRRLDITFQDFHFFKCFLFDSLEELAITFEPCSTVNRPLRLKKLTLIDQTIKGEPVELDWFTFAHHAPLETLVYESLGKVKHYPFTGWPTLKRLVIRARGNLMHAEEQEKLLAFIKLLPSLETLDLSDQTIAYCNGHSNDIEHICSLEEDTYRTAAPHLYSLLSNLRKSSITSFYYRLSQKAEEVPFGLYSSRAKGFIWWHRRNREEDFVRDLWWDVE